MLYKVMYEICVLERALKAKFIQENIKGLFIPA